MPAAAVVTLIGVGILVLALAYYLIRIAWTLRQVIDTLGKVTFGVRAIAYQTEPVNEIAAEIQGDVEAMEKALRSLLDSKLSQRDIAG